MGLLTRTSTFQPHPQGIVTLTLRGVTWEAEGQYGPQLRFGFDSSRLMDSGEPYRVSKWVKPSLNEKSNLYALIRDLGSDPEDAKWEAPETPEELVDLLEAELSGAQVQAVIKNEQRADGTLKDRIDSMLPVDATPAPPQRQQTARPANGGVRQPAQQQPRRVAAGAGTMTAEEEQIWNE